MKEHKLHFNKFFTIQFGLFDWKLFGFVMQIKRKWNLYHKGGVEFGMRRKRTVFLPSNKQILNLNNIHYIGARLQRRGFIVYISKSYFDSVKRDGYETILERLCYTC